MKNPRLLLTLVLGLSFALSACKFDGEVVQGRCVAYDEANKTITIVVEKTPEYNDGSHGTYVPVYENPGQPNGEFTVRTFKLPTEAMDIGPLPTETDGVGDRLLIDLASKKLLYYDQSGNDGKGSLGTMSIADVSNVGEATDPEEYKKLLKEGPYPKINGDQVTINSSRLKSFITFTIPEGFRDKGAEFWRAGDEIRIAYRIGKGDDPNQAIRLMNVTKTDIFKR